MLSRALVLLLLTLVACLPTWMLPELDGTEGRRVQIAVEMVASGDWLVPTLGHEPTWAKPPLHYWLLAACLQWCGDHPMLLRLPAVLSAAFAAWLCGELLRRWFGPRAGWIGALGIACSPLVVTTWPSAEIDPLFASLTAMSLCTLATGVARDRRALVLVSGVLAGLAMLQKGPPFFLFGVGAYLVWWRQRRCRHGLLHFLPMLLVALAYFVPLWLLRVDPGAMLAVAQEESVGRVSLFEWQHVRAIPEFWLRAIAVPMPLALWYFWEWRDAREPRVDADAVDLTLRMARGAAVLAVVVLTFFPGRATRYILPNVLLVTFAVAPAVAHFVGTEGPLSPFVRRAIALVGALATLALVVLPFVPLAGVGAIGLAAAAAVGARFVRTPRHLVAFVLVLPVLAAWTVGLDRSLQWSDGRRARGAAAMVLQRELQELGVPRDHDVATVGHFDSALLLGIDRLPPGDEQARRPVGARWVLHEVGGMPISAAGERAAVALRTDYRERLRLCLPFKTFVVSERLEGR